MLRDLLPIFVTSLSVAILHTSPLCAAPQLQQRILPLSTTPLRDLVLQEDDVVVVAKPDESIMPPAGVLSIDAAVAFSVGSATTVVEARVLATHSKPTERGNWIETEVVASVDAVINASNRRALPRQVTFTLDGGETVIGHTTVRSEWVSKLHKGDRLLLGFRQGRAGGAVHASKLVMVVNGDGTLDPWYVTKERAPYADPLKGADLKRVERILKSMKLE
ncbi:MAG: hypothetical protein QM736_08305 [Vicinamibacterales bacterium]